MARLTSLNFEIYKTAPKGTTVDGVVIGPSGKPDNDPTTNWVLMGSCTKFSINNNSEVYTSIVGVNGQAAPSGQITTKKQLDVSIEFETLTDDILVYIMNGKQDQGSTTTWTTYDGSARYEGWIKVQAYNSEENGTLLWA